MLLFVAWMMLACFIEDFKNWYKEKQAQKEKLRNKEKEQAAEREAIRDNLRLENKIVTCETCKCLVYRKDSSIGKQEIRSREEMTHPFGLYSQTISYIYTPYYCGKCAPKNFGNFSIVEEIRKSEKKKVKKGKK